MNLSELKNFAYNIRKMGLSLALEFGNQGSHIGGGMSCVEIFAVLYGHAAHFDVKNPLWDERDRILPSKAHCILAQLPALCILGYFTENELYETHKDNGVLYGRPYKPEYGLEFSGGSLGMGIGLAVGMAITAKQERRTHHVYTLLGDGECNEGSVWEAFMTAAKYKLDNLTVIIDNNGLQYDGPISEVMPMNDLDDRLRAFGFHVESVDGHDIEELCKAFDSDPHGRPKAIIAHTVKARGVARLEDLTESHHTPLTRADYEAAIIRLEAEMNA